MKFRNILLDFSTSIFFLMLQRFVQTDLHPFEVHLDLKIKLYKNNLFNLKRHLEILKIFLIEFFTLEKFFCCSTISIYYPISGKICQN